MVRPYIIAIAGGSGSGKTTLANQLRDILGKDNTTILSQDAFYKDRSHLTPEKRVLCNFDNPDAIDWYLFHDVVNTLKNGNTANVPNYDFVTHTRSGHHQIEGKETLIIEGHLLLTHPQVRKLFDVSFFLSVDLDIMFIRRLQRDISERGRTSESVWTQYLNDVRPMYSSMSCQLNTRQTLLLTPQNLILQMMFWSTCRKDCSSGQTKTQHWINADGKKNQTCSLS